MGTAGYAPIAPAPVPVPAPAPAPAAVASSSSIAGTNYRIDADDNDLTDNVVPQTVPQTITQVVQPAGVHVQKIKVKTAQPQVCVIASNFL